MASVRSVCVSLLAWSVLGCGSVSSSPDGGQDAAAGAAGVGAAGAGQAGASAAGAGAAAGSTGAAGAGAAGAGGATSPAAPGPFTLKTPVDGDPTVSPTPTLTWNASAGGALSYIVEIATTPAFDTADVKQTAGITTTSLTLTDALLPGVIYYWRVAAVSGGGETFASDGPFAMSSPVAAGPSPHGIAVTPDGKQAVVTNDKPSGSVTLVDLAAFTTQTIALTGQPGMVAVTPDGAHALVAEGSPNNVVVVDLAGKTVAGTISPPCVATTLYGIAIAPDGTAAVLPDFNAGCTKDVLDVVALPGTAIAPVYDLGTSASAFGVAVTPNSATALVTRGILATSVKRVELATGALTTIANTSASFGVAVAPGGAEALVSSGEGDTIKRISLTSNTVTGMITFETNQDVGNLAIAPNGKLAVAVGDFKIGIINLTDGGVARSVSLTGRSVAITPDGHRALVTGTGATGKVYVIPLP